MSLVKGYIYVRCHTSYDIVNICKIGKTTNIPDRDTQYATSEYSRGYFTTVFQVPIKQMDIIERLIQYEFKFLHSVKNGGTEFYNKEIIDRLEPYLIGIGIKYNKLTKDEISNLLRRNRVKNTLQKINKNSLLETLRKSGITLFTPRADQSEIINNATTYFGENNKGMLLIPCGVGKTLISLWITQKIKSKKIIIGVPSILLLKQWLKIIQILFKGVKTYTIFGENNTDTQKIKEFLKHKVCIIITTYASAYKISEVAKEVKYKFDMKILDEVHHLTSNNMELANTTKKYVEMLNIPSIKQISLTATIRNIDAKKDSDNIISNENKKYFGNVIIKKSLSWAIKQNLICDYVIQTIITDKEIEHPEFFLETDTDKILFLSAFIALKSICDKASNHLLIYCNNKENTNKITTYLRMFLEKKYFDFDVDGLYYSNYHSDIKPLQQMEILNKFEKNKYGIITCVYCLGEGWDFPLLDGVVFAENMSSNIRILQSALRASRKNKKDPNKLTKILIPIINKDNWLGNSENSDFKKVREIILKMGMEDEMISEKIKLFKINIENQNSQDGIKLNSILNGYDVELTKKLKLQTIQRDDLILTYEKARKIISENKIHSKNSYYGLCDRDNRLPKDPQSFFNKKFIGWIDYLNMKDKFYKFKICKKKVGEYLKKNNCMDLKKIITNLREQDNSFPPNDLWFDYYDIADLKEIIDLKVKKKENGL